MSEIAVIATLLAAFVLSFLAARQVRRRPADIPTTARDAVEAAEQVDADALEIAYHQAVADLEAADAGSLRERIRNTAGLRPKR